MRNLKILNTREIKDILEKVKKQWGAELDLDYAFLLSPKNKIYLVNKEISKIDWSRLRLNNLGLYFGTLTHGKLRLSIEGSQMIGPEAKKNVVELNKDQARQWFNGERIFMDANSEGFVILRFGQDFLGCGKYSDNKILNYVPKARRIDLI